MRLNVDAAWRGKRERVGGNRYEEGKEVGLLQCEMKEKEDGLVRRVWI